VDATLKAAGFETVATHVVEGRDGLLDVPAGTEGGEDGGEGGDGDEVTDVLLLHGFDDVSHGLEHAGLAEDVNEKIPRVGGVCHGPHHQEDDRLGAGVAGAVVEHLLHDIRRGADAVGGQHCLHLPHRGTTQYL
jgi:hypothetical protein